MVGHWTIENGASLDPSMGTIRTSSAVVTLNGPGAAIAGFSGLTTNNGVLSLRNGQPFVFSRLANAFSNTGLLDLGGSIARSPAFTLNNSGRINLQAGLLTMPAGTNSGTYDAWLGTTLNFNVGHTHTNGAQILGAGTVNFSGGNQTVSGIVTVNAPLNVFNGGSRVDGPGELRIVGPLHWYGNAEMTGSGKTVFASTSVVTLDGAGGGGAYFFRTVENFGTVNWSAERIRQFNTTFINREGGVVNASYFQPGTGFQSENLMSTVINEGIFNRTGNTNASNINNPNGPFTFDNTTGTINVLQGTLNINTGGTNSAIGAINVAAGATLRYVANYTFAAGTTINGAGTTRFEAGAVNLLPGMTTVNTPVVLTNGGVRITGAGDLTLTKAVSWGGNAEMTGAGGTIFSPTSVVAIDGAGGGGAYFFRPVENFGTINWTAERIRQFNTTFINREGGVINASYSGASTGFQSENFMSTVINEGIFNRTGNTDTSNIYNPNGPLTFNNTGQIRVTQGSLNVNPTSLTQLSGTSLTGGSWTVDASAAAATLVLGSASISTIGAAARVELIGPSSTFAQINPLTTVNGTLTLGTGRDFNAVGSLTNNGTLRLGTSTINVNGNYTQTGTGLLDVEIGGASPGQFGRVLATGIVSLAGELRARLRNFLPANGATFRIVDGSSRVGTFSRARLTSFDTIYDGDGVTLRFGQGRDGGEKPPSGMKKLDGPG
jgi:filamentous hemagglutinin